VRYIAKFKRGHNSGFVSCEAENDEDAKWQFCHAPEFFGCKVDLKTVRPFKKKGDK
jgi:hypothetical protein